MVILGMVYYWVYHASQYFKLKYMDELGMIDFDFITTSP